MLTIMLSNTLVGLFNAKVLCNNFPSNLPDVANICIEVINRWQVKVQ